jgi:hypothetical protein
MLHLKREFSFLHSKERLNASILHFCTAEYTEQARNNITFYFANLDVEIGLRCVSCAFALKTLTSLYSGIWIYGWTSPSQKSYYFLWCCFLPRAQNITHEMLRNSLDIVTNTYGKHSR